MKFSINLAQKYSNVDLKRIDGADIIRRIGAQLGAVEAFTDYTERYRNIVVVRVVSCTKHENADKLSICMVDDGGAIKRVERNAQGLIQIVCGADNVKADMYAAWIPPGTVVPSTVEKAPFTIGAREIRGIMSYGMLASPRELDAGDDHDGILQITAEKVGRDPQPGEHVAPLYQLDDFVVDCENKMFTHRPDCFGNLGIARELAGIFDMDFKSPDWYLEAPQFEKATNLQLQIVNKAEKLVPRFMCVVMDNVHIASSPITMQGFLKRVGIKPVNNVVDVTNYVMHVLGQPLHAFDYDKLSAKNKNEDIELGPRMAKDGEELALLGGKTIKLSKEDVVISSGGEAVALGGIMGGSETEVDENTKRIVIECANFDMYAMRRTSMRHGVFTDALTRFNKGQSPLQNDRAVLYAMRLLKELASATQASPVYDETYFHKDQDNLNHVNITASFINKRLGTELAVAEIARLLKNVECGVAVEEDNIAVTVPFWRMDIAIPEDIVEEVGRLYGYDRVPVSLPPRTAGAAAKNHMVDFKYRLRDLLQEAGANEVLTYSFVHGDLMRNTGVNPDKWAFHVRNALSPDLQYYRTSLVPSLLQKVHGNIKAQAGSDSNEFALFEIGKSHIKGDDEVSEKLPKQMRRLALVVAADDKAAKKRGGSAYYLAKKYIDYITNAQAIYTPLQDSTHPMTAPYQKGRSAVVELNNQAVGVIGEFHAGAQKSFKLPKYCAGFELNTDLLQQHYEASSYKPMSSFPGTHQDLTFEIGAEMTWSELQSFVYAEVAVAAAIDGYEFDIEPLDIFVPEGSNRKRVSLRVHLGHYKKTLRTEEANRILEHVANVAETKLGVSRV